MIVGVTKQHRAAAYAALLLGVGPCSDCMTGEGKALDAGDKAAAAGFTARKSKANADLLACSLKYNALMKTHRESLVAK